MDAAAGHSVPLSKANMNVPSENDQQRTADFSELSSEYTSLTRSFENTDSTRPESTCGSQGHPAPSTAPSLSSLSLEERLRRMRAAEEIRQKQRYAAYLESQKQAEQARIKAQEERRIKLEEMHQRAEARRQCVLQRRQEIELSNKARLDLIRERSRARDSEQTTFRRRHTDSSTIVGRTASASPSIGSARNPNHLMTTSCMVAFGSSAPRSILPQNRSASTQEFNTLGRPAQVSSRVGRSRLPPKPDSINTKRPPSAISRTLPKGMSVSVHVDQTESKATTVSKKPVRKRSLSPKSKTLDVIVSVPLDSKTNTPQEPLTLIDQEPVNDAGEQPKSIVDPSEERNGEVTQPTLADELNELANIEASESSDNQTSASLAHLGPLTAEIHGAGEGSTLKESEAAIYRAKFSEQRRLAKERKEEEQRRFLEAQQQLLLQEEAARLAAEKAEREAAERAEREAAEAQRLKDEAEKAKLRAAEAERLSKLQRAEEERIKRKQRLDDIMSRVKQTNKSSSVSSSGSVSTPFLFGQDAPFTRSDAALGDASDSKLMQRDETHNNNELVFKNFADGSDSQVPSDVNDNPPVRFTLTEAVNGNTQPEQNPSEAPINEVVPESQNSHSDGIYDAKPARHSTDNSLRPDFLDAPVITTPSSVPNSPSKGDLSGDESTTKTSAPQFKSALLQSMLGKGRLETRAKDAVAGLRSRYSASQLGDIQSNGNHNDAQSFPTWTQPNPSGDGPLAKSPHPNGSPLHTPSKELNGSNDVLKSPTVTMVRSMYEGSGDQVHVNGSRSSIPHEADGDFLDLAKAHGTYPAADDRQSLGSPVYAWSSKPDRDMRSPESITVPLPTSSN